MRKVPLAGPQDNPAPVTVTVAELHVYPVKGLAGIRLSRARLTPRGLEHDRRFMVVDGAGTFLTQREHPRMATVWTEIADGELLLSAPDRGEVTLPLAPDAGERLSARVWNSLCEAIAPSPEADAWLSDFLGLACRLAYMPEWSERQVNPAYAGPGHLVGFADGYPVLVTSVSSLADLNARLRHPVPMNRFRPNLVVAGAPAYAEDDWRELRAGEARLRIAKPCERCQVTTTDQATGEVRGAEPLATLSAYRATADYSSRFGMNAVVLQAGLVEEGAALALSGGEGSLGPP